MMKNFGESLKKPENINESVKKAYSQLSSKLAGKDLMFKKGSEEIFYALTNPAGNISIHDFKNGCDYILWQDGEIEALDTSDPEKIVDVPTVEYLDALITESSTLETEELKQPE